MRKWFFEHYTNPLDNTPYESAEGGYIFIWGGPFDANEQLQGEFSGIVDDEVIDELADELNEITDCGKELMQPFLRLLYANVITALETYLFDLFYSSIQNDKALFRKFIEENEEYKRENIKRSQLIESTRTLKKQ